MCDAGLWFFLEVAFAALDLIGSPDSLDARILSRGRAESEDATPHPTIKSSNYDLADWAIDHRHSVALGPRSSGSSKPELVGEAWAIIAGPKRFINHRWTPMSTDGSGRFDPCPSVSIGG